jgi:hypothetical protein
MDFASIQGVLDTPGSDLSTQVTNAMDVPRLFQSPPKVNNRLVHVLEN